MRSLLEAPNANYVNNKAVCLTALAYGKQKDVFLLVKAVQDILKEHFERESCCVFEDSTLNRAEFHRPISAPKTKFNIRLTGEKSFSKSYTGFWVGADKWDLICHQQFDVRTSNNILANHELVHVNIINSSALKAVNIPSSSLFSSAVFHQSANYNREKVQDVLKKRFENEMVESTLPLMCDIRIRLQYDVIGKEIAQFRLECCQALEIPTEINAEIEWCKKVITQLDNCFGKCLHSAYISYNPIDCPILLEHVYRSTFMQGFIIEPTRIQGVEYITYLSNTVFQSNPVIEPLEPSYEMDMQILTSGVLCIATGSITQFNRQKRTQIERTLAKYLLQMYGIYSINELFIDNWYYPLDLGKVFVFGMLQDCEIALFCGYDDNDICDRLLGENPFRHLIDTISL